MIEQWGRILLALVLACIAAYLVISFVTMPYQVVTIPPVTTTSGYSVVKTDGTGTLILAVIFALLAVFVSFADDW